MKKYQEQKIIRKQVSRRLDALIELRDQFMGVDSWVDYVRLGLGMSLVQLASRLGLAQSSVSQSIRLEKEGRLPAAVKETLNQIFSDPRVSKQLQITGEYNYQSYTPEMLKKKISNQETTILAAQNFQIAQLTLMKTNAKTQEDKDKIDVEIGNIENSIETITGQYKELKETADTNPDAINLNGRCFIHINCMCCCC
jgi:transcriptional regulator with XRE-family HTH domain